eukprot:7458000-Pyramimonas_sp.AAC.1
MSSNWTCLRRRRFPGIAPAPSAQARPRPWPVFISRKKGPRPTEKSTPDLGRRQKMPLAIAITPRRPRPGPQAYDVGIKQEGERLQRLRDQ